MVKEEADTQTEMEQQNSMKCKIVLYLRVIR